jgi:hypothetical protein
MESAILTIRTFGCCPRLTTITEELPNQQVEVHFVGSG